MSGYTSTHSDIKTLIGQQVYAGYEQQAQDSEAAKANEYEPLTCYFCQSEIQSDQAINLSITPSTKAMGGLKLSQPLRSAMSNFTHGKVTSGSSASGAQ